ncbi:MAG: sugar phosphate isomerase/epimerase family protein [Candidatus Thorarchaeota archaeon]
MELGISSLGYLSDIDLDKNYKNPIDLQIESFKQSLDFSEKNGIKIVELVIEPTNILKKENHHKLVDLVKSYSLQIQIHGPFIDMNLCSYNKNISQASVQSYLDTIEFCHELNSKTITIHPGYANFLLKSIRSFNTHQLKKNINILLDLSNKYEIDMCLENMPKNANIMTDHINIKKVYENINREDLFLTYDTSHYFMSNGNVEQLWKKFSNKIRNIHIVDSFDKKSDKHPELGIGIINFKEIFEVIKSYNYNGPLIIELSSSKSLSKSINFINKFL